MPTLNIQGKRVKVDESFLSLSPEEQSRTVDEIAAQIGVSAQPEKPAVSGQHLSFEEGQKLLDQEAQSGMGGKIGAFTTGALDGVPIAGPAILGGVQRASAALGSAINGKDYAENLKTARTVTNDAQAQNPMTTMAGNLTGATLPMAAAGGTALGAQALGITGRNLATRVGASALSSGAISAADTAARGGDIHESGWSGVVGGGIGGAIPLAGAALSAAGRIVGDRIAPTINAIKNPSEEAQRRIGLAIKRDAEAGASGLLSSADEAVAQANNIPLINADRGGETTRALARSVANQSPEARATIEKTASDRFGAQSQRAASFIQRLAGGNADDLALQERIQTTSRLVNKPAYDAAMNSDAAQQVFTRPIQELMQSPSFRKAVESVPSRSADRAAVEGFKEIQYPFTKNSQGAWTLKKKADGTIVTPTLRFWDMVKRNLDSEIGVAKRAGDNTRSSELMGLKTKLVNELDTVVPDYQTARRGAAAFFGAEDALDAGRKFADTPRLVPETTAAFQKFTDPEKEAFATGYASQLVDKIKATGDRTNVINSIFKSQASRESMELVFGPQRLKEIEAYVRVEDIADRLRGAMGNSTTARQLMELGIGAGGGAYMTGDWSGALAGAALAKGARMAGERADNAVMKKVAEMLMSDNRGNIALAVRQASKQPQYMAAIEKLGNVLAVPSRVAGIQGN